MTRTVSMTASDYQRPILRLGAAKGLHRALICGVLSRVLLPVFEVSREDAMTLFFFPLFNAANVTETSYDEEFEYWEFAAISSLSYQPYRDLASS